MAWAGLIPAHNRIRITCSKQDCASFTAGVDEKHQYSTRRANSTLEFDQDRTCLPLLFVSKIQGPQHNFNKMEKVAAYATLRGTLNQTQKLDAVYTFCKPSSAFSASSLVNALAAGKKTMANAFTVTYIGIPRNGVNQNGVLQEFTKMESPEMVSPRIASTK